MIESGVDLAEGGLDLAGVAGRAARGVVPRKRDQGPEETGAQLDEEHPELEAAWRQAITAAGAKPFHQAVGPQLGQVVAQLAEPVVPLR